ncbi:type I restriction-modification system subunit M [Corynebacterium aurimucosum]|uniref:site-specific DNA-methyltransferase (adenine-specific) n=2 Tax=Corynebacterium TaxID=1716 RepID=A0ABY3CX37_9CORY|nr:type I restriction-modification system subunit M [Corynebacterium guaraldiae]NJJ83849.1 type I restriction-modification system subunit M [Corynebacterium aurimucosum]OFK27768.1 type I restriction endonuclease subunit M [Corynebacterium sp. HMSC062E11]OFK63519.1 type I restriction endonuclease subunit M [Corynebacterium sp. HMSC078A10]OFL60448.1 type I restriction endonuclease subunit M [Corynebacterium sp. HMSC065D07]OFP71152.1 type I restriction endonuclease subunit M [Corynebacterium sp. 
MEAQDYKDYILGFIFYKFLSDQVEQFMLNNDAEPEDLPDALVETDTDTVALVRNNLGYFLTYENLYSTWRDMGNDFSIAHVRDGLATFKRNIAPEHKHVFEGILNTLDTSLSKLGTTDAARTSAIKKLLDLIDDIPTDGKQGYDVLGYIYEYLIEKFAANAGKKAGEFYTPHEVSLIMSNIVADHLKDRDEIQIYDPTSGSGSLLLNIGHAVAKRMGDPDRIKYFAQELRENTYNLTRMNLVMRGVKADNIVARNGDSLAHDWPMFDEFDPVQTYQPLYVDAVVSDPPYSQKWEPEGNEADPRFARFGLAPKTKADYAFLLHELFHVKPDGILTIVLPHGVLFRGSSEADIRRNLIEANHIDAIIGLPSNIFYGTGIATIIMVLKQERDRDDVLFIDASQGFIKQGKYNHLRARDIQRIVDAVRNRVDVPHFAKVVTRDEIRANDHNLNIPRYVSATLPPESVDLYATMHGGIPTSEIAALEHYWTALPGLREALFTEKVEGYAELKTANLRETIDKHPAAQALRNQVDAALSDLPEKLHALLVDGAATVPITTTEDQLKADLFDRLDPVPLVDAYEGYQVLHDSWVKTAGDLEVIQTEGFDALRVNHPVMEWKTKEKKKVYVQIGWDGRVAPNELVQTFYLAQQKDQVTQLSRDVDTAVSELTQLVEGLSEVDKTDLTEILNDKQDAFKKTELNKAIKDLPKLAKGETWPEDSTEAAMLSAKALIAQRDKLKKNLKAAQEQLEKDTYATIEALTEAQVDEVLTAKWITSLMDDLREIPGHVLAGLAGRVQALHDKYAVALTDLDVKIRETEQELAGLLSGLTGNAADMQAVAALQELLGGGRDA